MAVPVQPRLEKLACALGSTAFNARLVDLANREHAKSKVWRQSRRPLFGFSWRRDPTWVLINGFRTGEPVETAVSRAMAAAGNVPFRGIDIVLRFDFFDSDVACDNIRLGRECV
jgi:hypothetical protein